MIFSNIAGVPRFESIEFSNKKTNYCLLIPTINEHGRIEKELYTAQNYNIDKLCDIIICDGGSTDGSMDPQILKSLGVNTLLIKRDIGKLGAQIRMGFWWALRRGYNGFITIDGNNKDSIQDVTNFIDKLDKGYDFVQGSRFIEGGKAINTPLIRLLAVKLIHAPIISLTAKKSYLDSTNAFRAYSRRYINHPEVQPFRDIFKSYEILAYLSVRANQIGLKTCEIPVTRVYPKNEKTPTKISPIKGNLNLFIILLKNFIGLYLPDNSKGEKRK